MYERICKETTLLQAFLEVRKNKGAGGIDGVTLESFQKNLGTHIRELSRLLKERRYTPLPVKRVYIPKARGKLRPLGIPAIRDRVVQQAVRTVVESKLETLMSEDSYGFRKHRGAHTAIEAIERNLKEGYTHIVDADISDFFGTINHQTLMNKVREALPDKEVTYLIHSFLRAGVMEEGRVRNQSTGTPQGGVISPLLANLYLTDFDHKVVKTGARLVRYADDFVLMAKSKGKAKQAYHIASDVLAKLKLSFAPEKTRLTSIDEGFDFLGYTFWRKHIFPSDKSQRKFKDKVREMTRRQQPTNVAMVVERLAPVIKGWCNYFSLRDGTSRFRALDELIRRRLRSFVAKEFALSKSSHMKYPNSFFKELGLPSLFDLHQERKALRLSL